MIYIAFYYSIAIMIITIGAIRKHNRTFGDDRGEDEA